MRVLTATDRVVVPVTYGFSVRYLLHAGVLEEMRTRCHPVVALGWDDPDLVEEFERRGFEVRSLPGSRIEHGFRKYWQRVAAVHERRLDSPSMAYRRRRWDRYRAPKTRAIQLGRRVVDRGVTLAPGRADALVAAEEAETVAGTNLVEFERFLSEVRGDAVLSVTPYHDQDRLLVWAGVRAGVPVARVVTSFDNPTIRGRLPGRSEVVGVWNRYNADEILRSHPEVADAAVTVLGAPQFDLHRRPDLVMPEDEWRRSLGIPEGRPVVLYGAGPSLLVPHEPALVAELDAAMRERPLPGDPFVLVRKHPSDTGAGWDRLDLAADRGTVVSAWGTGADPKRNWPTEDDLVVQMSTLAHCAVHINVCSSMTLDGAMFDRPQISPVFVPGATATEKRVIRNLYRQEHWQPLARSGGVEVARDVDSLWAAVRAALVDPAAGHEGRRRMIGEVLTHDDGGSSRRLAECVASLRSAGTPLIS